jgi:hypothetical protein
MPVVVLVAEVQVVVLVVLVEAEMVVEPQVLLETQIPEVAVAGLLLHPAQAVQA